MQLNKPQQVLDTIRAGDDAAWAQSENRRRIDEQANMAPPLTPDAARKLNLKVNVNFGTLAIPLAHAKRSYEDATLGQERCMKITIPSAPPDRKTEIELTISNAVNELLKEDEDISDDYVELKSDQIGTVVTHGLGPVVWWHPDDLLPDFVALNDWRVPTDSKCSLKNVEWFAVRHRWTPGECVDHVWNKHSVPGWDKKVMAEILSHYKAVNYGEVSYTWESDPESMAELVKQNMLFYSNDAMPTIPIWAFYFKDQDGGNDWYLACVPDTESLRGVSQEKFLYKSDRPVASKLSHLLQCQYGDISNHKPAMIKSVRSLGFMLMDSTWWDNVTRGRLMQHAHDSMNPWFRVNDPSGRARAQLIELYDKCIVPEGVDVVEQAKRHQIDVGLIQAVQAQLKQSSNEASASYTHELDTGTQKEQTATETMANLQRVNAMLSGLLGRWFRGEKRFDREFCRRLCLTDTTNETAKKFQTRMHKLGIESRWLNVSLWVVEPEKPVGSGNPTMAILIADKLMSMLPVLSGEAQERVKNIAVAAYSGDPKLANELAPIGQKSLPTAVEFAQSIFGSLMQGVSGIAWKAGLSLVDGISTLVRLVEEKVQQILKLGGMTDMNTVVGLTNTAQFTRNLLTQLEQDPDAKPTVKALSEQLGNAENEIRGFAQRLEEQQAQTQGPNGFDPKAMAALQGKMMLDKAKARQTELKGAQSRRHKELGFQADQRRQDQKTAAEVRRDALKAAVDMQANRMRSMQE